jgi:2-oxoglutarate dehydrogenase E2 component (dihydrolipoamide succinyltransferase)
MAMDIKVPSVGESVVEGVLARWIKKNGEVVKANEPLFELETDKATQEVAAPAGGVLQILVKEGEKVAIGSLVGRLDEIGTTAAVAVANSPVVSVATGATGVPALGAEPAGPILMPAARQAAADLGIDPSKIFGTGKAGRILKEDVLAASQQPASPQAIAPVSAPTPSLTQVPPGARTESRTRMSPIRTRIAERLLQAQQNAAILTTFNEVDMSAVMELRTKFKESFQKRHGISLGFMSFFVRAVVEGLKAFPLVHSRIDGNEIVTPSYADIGVAVSTEKGLMVPVLRTAENLSFAKIEQTITDMAKRARDNKIHVSELQGGTFTITNGGVFGSLLSTPIINPPQSAILGMHTIQKRPVVVDDQIVIRPMMYLALSYDHRIIDGKEAVSFLVRVKDCIENPERILLEV